MKRTVARLVTLCALFGLLIPGGISVSYATCPNQTGSGASSARFTCPPAPDPNQAAYDKLRKRLGGDVARALASQEQLSIALLESAASEQNLNTQIASEESKIAALEAQVTQLETNITDTQSQIDMEQAELATLAVAISRQPDSLLVAVAQAGNLHDALVAAADLIVASQRANDLETSLEADMAKLQVENTAQLAALSTENGVLAQLSANLTALSSAISQQNDITTQLGALMAQLTSAKAGLTSQPPVVTAALAALLEQQEQQLIQMAYQAAWNQGQVGAGIAMVTRILPPGTTLPGLRLSWPIAGAWITQPFGPSELLLEPPLGPYPHFHTGIDIAAPYGTPVTAAADGVVVAVAHTNVGYGNYVIIAHGGGIMTLYGHLAETAVNVGDRVTRGQRIGLEGMSGLATGPHVHFELRVNDEVTDPMPYLPPLIGGVTPKP
ncbi:MAG TPA: peptidoglycan DD-metalloendopeptidase family protein [Candidatus Micrarchaeaceae archaeon]|nr:peptidoglycan DD-metalloendopeptidase family protein [Candidatus Micrarchaeaceae archaeon]